MATSSFSKTFVFDETVLKKIQESPEYSNEKDSLLAKNKIKEGKKALAQFSFHSKK